MCGNGSFLPCICVRSVLRMVFRILPFSAVRWSIRTCLSINRVVAPKTVVRASNSQGLWIGLSEMGNVRSLFVRLSLKLPDAQMAKNMSTFATVTWIDSSLSSRHTQWPCRERHSHLSPCLAQGPVLSHEYRATSWCPFHTTQQQPSRMLSRLRRPCDWPRISSCHEDVSWLGSAGLDK